MVFLAAILHKVMCLKKYRYPQNTAGTMAAIFGDQFRWQIMQRTVYYSFQSKKASVM